MFGKVFAALYSGSLFGKPAIIFAVWTYCIANMRPSRADGECYVEINPALLAATFAATIDEIHRALDLLESPDTASRSAAEEGRRLIRDGDSRHDGPMQYRVVNGSHYRAMRDEEERRIYLRDAKRRERARKTVNNVVNVNRGLPPSTQAEAEAEAEETLSSDFTSRLQSLFEERWKTYPKKDGKKEALRHFRASVHDEEDLVRFDRALTNYLRKLAANGISERFTKNGSTFFNNWSDFADAETTTGAIRPEGRGMAFV